jgi:hypothetical protein
MDEKQKREIWVEVAWLTGGVVVFMLFVCALGFGAHKQERVDCYEWQGWAEEYPHTFFLLPWQKQMCDGHGIIINAPIYDGQ